MSIEDCETFADGDAGRAIAFGLMAIAEAIRDAAENIALALDALAPETNAGERSAAGRAFSDAQPEVEEGEY